MTQLTNLAEQPIVLGTNPFTGRVDGDDTGYRSYPISIMDEENPDPLVPINTSNEDITVYPIYARGSMHRVCPYYVGGLGANPTVLLRKPAFRAVINAHQIAKFNGRSLFILDGWRSADTQAQVFASVFMGILGEKSIDSLSIQEFIQVGLKADEIGSYAKVLKNQAYWDAYGQFIRNGNLNYLKDLINLFSFPKGIHDLADYYLTFQRNLGKNNLTLDHTAPTAHGSGGAVDTYMINNDDGEISCLGVPFDHVSPVAQMDFFENHDNYEIFVQQFREDPILKEYLNQCGLGLSGGMRIDGFYAIRAERRILYHSMQAVGASIYVAEPWHFNLDNTRGGNQLQELSGSGSVCHALLKGLPEAVWSNKVAHELAGKFFDNN